MSQKGFITDYIRAQFQGTINTKIKEIIKEEADKAGHEVAKRVLELASQVAVTVERNSMDYMMQNQVRINVHIPSVPNDQT